MADTQIGTPGSPDWWFNRLLHRLMYRQARYDMLEAYVEGNHPLPDGDERYVKALKTMQQKARTNYIGMITTTPVERMKLKDFLVDGQPNKELASWWSENAGDLQANKLHLTSSSLGNSYVKLVMGKDTPFSTGLPKFVAVDPRICITEEDPQDPMLTRAALEMWQDEAEAKFYAVLYMPDYTYYFVGPATKDCWGLDIPQLANRLLSFGSGGFQLVQTEPTQYGVVPIIRFDWIATFGGISKAEAEDVIDVQNRINSTILDRMVISRSQAYKQRWAKGIKLPKTRSGQAKPPFDPGSDMLWVTEDAAAEFGEFSEADIRQILEAVRDDVADMAAITKTPPHYLMGKMANVSGSTLDQAEAGMISKTKQRMTSVGISWSRLAKLAFLYMGNATSAKSRVEVCWYDPAYHSRAELADAFVKETQGGVPPLIAASRLGLSAYELEQMDSYIQQEEVKAQQEQQAQLQMKQAAASQQSTGNTQSAP